MNHNIATLGIIYLAGGCFWGTQHFLRLIPGVVSTQVGYANSTVPSPSYKEVCTGHTDAAETVQTQYDTSVISLEEILSLYYMTIDPYSLNRQGGDRGTQYRTGIYTIDDHSLEIAEKFIKQKSADAPHKIMVEVKPLENFYPAEDYHQDYLVENAGGYCHVSPNLFEIAKDYVPLSLRPDSAVDNELARSSHPYNMQ